MINFIGCSCDKCNEKFTSESDIVVCPECGTPHHRHCYEELGHCVNQDKHAEGFEWKAPEREPNFKANICPRCQAENPKDAAFCEKCGIALAPQAKTQRTESNMPPVLEDFRQSRQKTSVVPPTLPKYLEGETDGVSYKDIAIYVGESAPYYVYHFKNLNSGTKRFRPFCWSAFFFDGFYFLYRKMWLEALSVILISGIFFASEHAFAAGEHRSNCPRSVGRFWQYKHICDNRLDTVCRIQNIFGLLGNPEIPQKSVP